MFYIVQMADFHFGGACHGAESEKDILKKMTERLQFEVPEGSEVVFCACGDYIDSKPIPDGVSTRALLEDEITARYQEAREAIESEVIKPLQKTYDLKIGLCVGNHDTGHILPFHMQKVNCTALGNVVSWGHKNTRLTPAGGRRTGGIP